MTRAEKIRVGILGSRGRMGQSVANLLKKEFVETAVLDGEADLNSTLEFLLNADVVIEFSSLGGALNLMQAALVSDRTSLPAFVFGSTGWNSDGFSMLEKLSTKARVLQASNFSIGINILSEILGQWGPVLENLGFQPAISDVHHRHKKDAPSGTALTLAGQIRPQSPRSMQINSVRAGEVVGDHAVGFYGQAEVLEFNHFAQDRTLFSRGAIQIALWLAKQKEKTGLITIKDYLHSLL